MSDTLARGSLRPNPYSAVTECLRIQATARRQGAVARLFGQNPVLPDARSWYRGAVGELQVARVLAGLDPSWTVLRAEDPPVLLIGSAGAFTVHTHNHSRQRVWVGDDRLLVNGRRTHHLRDARLDALELSRRLGTPVTPVLAIIDPGRLDIKHRPDGVHVLAASQLGSYLRRRPPRLPDEAIAGLLGSAAPWRADVVDETLAYEADFARLAAEVSAARWRRVGWAAGAAAVILAAVIVALMVA